MLFSKGAFVAGVWQQPADQGLRDETIARLIDPKTPPGVPNYAPFAGDLLAIPREQLQDRLYKLLENMGITIGLIFSGVCSSALSPFDVAEFPEGSTNRTLANVSNLLANIQFILCLGGMFSVTMHCLGLAVENDRTIYRVAANISMPIAKMSQVIVGSCLLLMAQMGCIIYIKSDPIYAHVIVGVMVAQFFFYGFGSSQHSVFTTFPCIGIHCLNDGISRIVTLPYGTYSKASLARIKESAAWLGTIKGQEVSNNFGAEVVKLVQGKINLEAVRQHDLNVESTTDHEAQDQQSAGLARIHKSMSERPQNSQVRAALRQFLCLWLARGMFCIRSPELASWAAHKSFSLRSD